MSLSGGTEHQVFSVQDEFLTFISVKRMERKGGLFRVPLMIRNHPCQPWEGRWSVGLPVWTTSRLPPLKMQRETTVDDRSSCTVMSVVMCGIPFAGGAAEGRVPPLSLFCLVLRGGVGQLEKHEPDTSA